MAAQYRRSHADRFSKHLQLAIIRLESVVLPAGRKDYPADGDAAPGFCPILETTRRECNSSLFESEPLNLGPSRGLLIPTDFRRTGIGNTMRKFFIAACALAALTQAGGAWGMGKTAKGAIAGAAAGALVAGPVGAVVGAGGGAVIGNHWHTHHHYHHHHYYHPHG